MKKYGATIFTTLREAESQAKKDNRVADKYPVSLKRAKVIRVFAVEYYVPKTKSGGK